MAKEKESAAQFYDRHMQRMAISMFLLAILFGISAVKFWIEGEIYQLLGRVQLVGAALVILILLPTFLKKMRMRGVWKSACAQGDGFILAAFKKAASNAFSATFITLLIALKVSESYLANLPTSFFISVVLFVSLGVCSVSFLFAIREPKEDFDDFESEDVQ